MDLTIRAIIIFIGLGLMIYVKIKKAERIARGKQGLFDGIPVKLAHIQWLGIALVLLALLI